MNVLKMICWLGFIGHIVMSILKLIMVFADETVPKRILNGVGLFFSLGYMYLFYYLLFAIKLFD